MRSIRGIALAIDEIVFCISSTSMNRTRDGLRADEPIVLWGRTLLLYQADHSSLNASRRPVPGDRAPILPYAMRAVSGLLSFEGQRSSYSRGTFPSWQSGAPKTRPTLEVAATAGYLYLAPGHASWRTVVRLRRLTAARGSGFVMAEWPSINWLRQDCEGLEGRFVVSHVAPKTRRDDRKFQRMLI